jgi:hypothetical protein
LLPIKTNHVSDEENTNRKNAQNNIQKAFGTSPDAQAIASQHQMSQMEI